MKGSIASLCIVIALAGAPARAGIALESRVLKADAAKTAGGETRTFVPATKAIPGDPMVYVLSYRNTGAQPVADVVLDSPVPATMVYRGAGTGTEPEVSIDGIRFGRLTDLTVTGPGGVNRPARLSDVVHVRWRIAMPVQPGAAGQVSFHAVLR